MRLSEAANTLDAALHGSDVSFRGLSTDTRTLEPGALFVALRGPNFDGHAFLDRAAAGGAAAAMLDAGPEQRLPVIEVPDTRRALGALAAAWRARFSLPLVAVTGSNGKTTVKEMLAAIFGTRGPVLATQGNLNNDIGVPLTLARLDGRHRAAVIEMGADRAGEIAGLVQIARPTVGVITLCAPSHLAGFGTVEGVARAKGELFEGLAPTGVAVINADDAFAGLWRELAAGRRALTFGLDAPADVTATWRAENTGTHLVIATPEGPLEVRLALPGRHNVMNALAAAAAAVAAGISFDAVASGLEAVRPIGGRLEPKRGVGGARVIDDTYNANPSSFEAALAVLAEHPGRRWLVLGDMLELGDEAPEYHDQAGELARASGVERLYAIGSLARRAVDAFGAGGLHFEGQTALNEALLDELPNDVTVLVKGSRSMHMERVVAALTLGDQ